MLHEQELNEENEKRQVLYLLDHSSTKGSLGYGKCIYHNVEMCLDFILLDSITIEPKSNNAL